jgi:dihydroorotase-like cyclic amidohydrolase
LSRSKNSPFLGRRLRGRAVLTLVAGRTAFAEEKFHAQ